MACILNPNATSKAGPSRRVSDTWTTLFSLLFQRQMHHWMGVSLHRSCPACWTDDDGLDAMLRQQHAQSVATRQPTQPILEKTVSFREIFLSWKVLAWMLLSCRSTSLGCEDGSWSWGASSLLSTRILVQKGCNQELSTFRQQTAISR